MTPIPSPVADLDIAAVVLCATAAVFVASLGGLVLRRASRVPALAKARLRACEQRLGTLEARLDRIEREFDAFGGAVSTKIEAMTVTLHSVTRGIDRIEDFLLKAAGDALMGARPAKTGDGDDK